ncbi:hypothetical protein [Streptomyces paradoxus]|uniref:hypothetical protein n=1 Tax=Streptomyces paradoxus TaxID=66375 RepID=UPI0037FBCCA6
MRPLYVPVRLAATVVAVAAAAGCMSVGDDAGGSVKPSHSAGQRAGGASDGGPAVSGGGSGFGPAGAEGERRRGKGGKGKKGKGGGAGASASPEALPSADASPTVPGHDKPGRPPRPTVKPPAPPTPTRTAEPEPTPTQEEPTTSPEPTPEPSSSAHEPPGPQLAQREPAPEAGALA